MIQCHQPKLFQPRRLGACEFRRTQVVEHRSSPQAQRFCEQLGGALRFAQSQRLLAEPGQLLELCGIKLIGMKEQAIPGLPGDERVLGTDGGQSSPEMGDMGAQGDVRTSWRLPAPECVGDPARRYAPVQVDQQHRKQLALLGAAELKPLPCVATSDKWTEDAEPRFPGHGAGSAEFHQVSVSTPVRRWYRNDAAR
jgi:hypothetical protein